MTEESWRLSNSTSSTVDCRNEVADVHSECVEVHFDGANETTEISSKRRVLGFVKTIFCNRGGSLGAFVTGEQISHVSLTRHGEELNLLLPIGAVRATALRKPRTMTEAYFML